MGRQKALEKMPMRSYPDIAAPASSHGMLIPTAFEKSMCKKTASSHNYPCLLVGYHIH